MFALKVFQRTGREVNPLVVRQFISLQMSHWKKRFSDGTTVTYVRIPDAYRKCYRWEDREAFAPLPEDN